MYNDIENSAVYSINLLNTGNSILY